MRSRLSTPRTDKAWSPSVSSVEALSARWGLPCTTCHPTKFQDCRMPLPPMGSRLRRRLGGESQRQGVNETSLRGVAVVGDEACGCSSVQRIECRLLIITVPHYVLAPPALTESRGLPASNKQPACSLALLLNEVRVSARRQCFSRDDSQLPQPSTTPAIALLPPPLPGPSSQKPLEQQRQQQQSPDRRRTSNSNSSDCEA